MGVLFSVEGTMTESSSVNGKRNLPKPPSFGDEVWKEYLVLCKRGEWVSVAISTPDPSWMEADKWYYSVVYVSSKDEGNSEKVSKQIAEAAVYRRLYQGLEYSQKILNQA